MSRRLSFAVLFLCLLTLAANILLLSPGLIEAQDPIAPKRVAVIDLWQTYTEIARIQGETERLAREQIRDVKTTEAKYKASLAAIEAEQIKWEKGSSNWLTQRGLLAKELLEGERRIEAINSVYDGYFNDAAATVFDEVLEALEEICDERGIQIVVRFREGRVQKVEDLRYKLFTDPVVYHKAGTVEDLTVAVIERVTGEPYVPESERRKAEKPAIEGGTPSGEGAKPEGDGSNPE